MSNIYPSVSGTAAAYSNSNVNQTSKEEKTTATKKHKVSGKTIGNPQLSDKAAKYYEELKKKYSNMDFILVSEDKKQQAQAQAGNYANANKMVVLIDEEKIEKMAEDENFRKQYEAIIKNAASGISQLKSSLSKSGTKVKSYGMKVNDNGTASYFAVLEKSSAAQKARIEKKAAEKREAKRTAERKAEKEKWQERLEQGREDRRTGRTEDTVTITANSADELIRKVEDYTQMSMSDFVQTEQEKKVGQNFDYSL